MNILTLLVERQSHSGKCSSFCKNRIAEGSRSDAATSPGRSDSRRFGYIRDSAPLLGMASVAPAVEMSVRPPHTHSRVATLAGVSRLISFIFILASAGLPQCPAGAVRKWRGPTFSVHALLADEWARVGLHDAEFTDRADRVSLGVEPVRQGWPPSPKECSIGNTLRDSKSRGALGARTQVQ